MATFTVFFSGTSATKHDAHNPLYPNGELVATLARNCQGKEFADWVIVDGPGSGNLQQDELWVKPGGYSSVTGIAFGRGWEENVAHAIAMAKGRFHWKREELTKENYEKLRSAGVPIQEAEQVGSFFWRLYNYGSRKVTPQDLQENIVKIFRKGGPIPTSINLVGWSRGGVSCHMMAHAMAHDPELKHVPIRILAIDPVPGPGNFQLHRTQLLSNVKEYVACYARDERSKGFACVIPEHTEHTKVSIFPMVGRHATLVGNGAIDGAEGRQRHLTPGIIVRHVAEVCLQRWGTDLSETLQLSQEEVQRRYQEIFGEDSDYIQMRNAVYTVFESIGANKERYVSHGSKGAAFSQISGEGFIPQGGLSTPVGFESVRHLVGEAVTA